MQEPWHTAVDRTPYVDGPDAELRSAAIDREHARTLAPTDPARVALAFSAAEWERQAARNAAPELVPDTIDEAITERSKKLQIRARMFVEDHSTASWPDLIEHDVRRLQVIAEDLAALHELRRERGSSA